MIDTFGLQAFGGVANPRKDIFLQLSKASISDLANDAFCHFVYSLLNNQGLSASFEPLLRQLMIDGIIRPSVYRTMDELG